jgi:hypothetical protein
MLSISKLFPAFAADLISALGFEVNHRVNFLSLKGLYKCSLSVIYFGDVCFVRMELQEKKELGELMLSLCYLPTAGRLTVTVIKARNLKAMDITGSSGAYSILSVSLHLSHTLSLSWHFN